MRPGQLENSDDSSFKARQRQAELDKRFEDLKDERDIETREIEEINQDIQNQSKPSSKHSARKHVEVAEIGVQANEAETGLVNKQFDIIENPALYFNKTLRQTGLRDPS